MECIVHCGAQIDSTSPLVFREYARACRVACAKSVMAIVGLRRSHSAVIGGNGRDVLTLVALCLWETRQGMEWGVDDSHEDDELNHMH